MEAIIKLIKSQREKYFQCFNSPVTDNERRFIRFFQCKFTRNSDFSYRYYTRKRRLEQGFVHGSDVQMHCEMAVFEMVMMPSFFLLKRLQPNKALSVFLKNKSL